MRFLPNRNTWPLKTTLGIGALVLGGVVLAQQPDNTTGTPPEPSAQPSPSASAAGQGAQGTSSRQIYDINLTPANASAGSSVARGAGRIVVDGENMGVYLEVTGLDPGIVHLQHLHAGSNCAGPEADTNGDNFVDAIEASQASGPPILPLSLNQIITTPQTSSSSEEYPVSSSTGSYVYIQSFPVAEVQAALNSSSASGGTNMPSASPSGMASTMPSPGASVMPGESPSPSVSVSASPSESPSAPPSEAAGQAGNEATGASPSPASMASPTASPSGAANGLDLENFVIEIHGVGASTNLPSTVGTLEGHSAQESLPVACGKIVKLGQ